MSMNPVEPESMGLLATTEPELRPGLPGSLAARPKMRLGLIAMVLAWLIVAGLVVGYVPRWRQRAALVSQTRDLAIPTVTVATPTSFHPASMLNLPAEVRPWLDAPLYARASGFLKRWLVDIGAKVEAGQLLAEIETPELDQELSRARADLAQAKAALGLSEATAARWGELLKTASVSEQEALEKRADLSLKQAALDSAQANVRRLEELQSFDRLVAPFAGTITARRTDIGQLISAGGGQELFHLAQIGRLRVYVRVPQAFARNIEPGQSAELRLPERADKVFTATVVQTAGAMSADSRTLLVELEVDNAGGEILAGSFAQVRFTEAKQEAHLSIPSNALLFRSEGPQVGVMKADEKVELRRIVLGRDFGQTLEVLSGVDKDDHVVLDPADALVSGTSVRVIERPKVEPKK